MHNLNDLLDLLTELSNLIDSPNTDVTWSRFETVVDVLMTIDTFKQQLKLGKDIAISELIILFGPTGSFQEISIDSGWGEKFLKLAARFDEIVASE
ncbi:hypothetical protein PAECIP111891_06975 [Paenibacillus allorhizoplanae]|uniref:Uncharacterized protein n=1 Tax=Paenibacillus allorhizoplanae TaxID=2905648 RepID=A0ABN8H6C3_9BACL|nr:hypothetical protein [Paenibacillus allorhizoplanae]CAH1232213.1 hypothetical protein PAECIP111891_06975 [Paenibacillus allorhizoplanae]